MTAIPRASASNHIVRDRAGARVPALDAPGTRVDDVTLAHRITRGMSADVFAAWHHALLTPVVCKRLRPEDAADAAHRRRLRLEGVALSLVSHPGVVRLLDLRHATPLPYLLLEHVGGPTLRDVLRRGGPLEVDAAVRIVQHLAAALAQVHARGFLHRDLKPSNVVLRGGRPVLLDFGVVWRLGPRRRPLDRSGTPQYLAAEQIMRAPLTPATDVYGLGVMLVELLTGERPFPEGARAAGAALTDRYPQLVRPPRVARVLPAGLAEMLDACLARDPRARPQSAVALAQALDPFTDVKVWPASLAGRLAPFETAAPVTRLRRLRS